MELRYFSTSTKVWLEGREYKKEAQVRMRRMAEFGGKMMEDDPEWVSQDE